MNQSELEANTRSRYQARENRRVQPRRDWLRHWLAKWREFFNQSQSVVKQNQRKRAIDPMQKWPTF